jgi:hypothetical protein
MAKMESVRHAGLFPRFIEKIQGTDGGTEETGLAYSENGIHWYRYGPDEPVLGRSAAGWDNDDSAYGTVLRDSDGIYHYWYIGGQHPPDPGLIYAGGIGYAISPNGIHWVKSLDNPIFHSSDGVSWRNKWTYAPFVLYSSTRFDGNGSPEQYKMWFSGKDTLDNEAIGYATLNPVSLSGADTSGSGQSGSTSSPLGQPFVVGLHDACGDPVSGVTVTFAISGTPPGAAGQSLSPLAGMTDGTGQVSTTLTLGGELGVYTATADATGVLGMPAIFTATATSGQVHRFVFAPVGDQIAGVDFTVTITAEDSSNIVTAYNGNVLLADSTSTVAPTTIGPFVNGVWSGSISITHTICRFKRRIL